MWFAAAADVVVGVVDVVDVVDDDVEEAVIAQECGAVAVMALERVPVRRH